MHSYFVEEHSYFVEEIEKGRFSAALCIIRNS